MLSKWTGLVLNRSYPWRPPRRLARRASYGETNLCPACDIVEHRAAVTGNAARPTCPLWFAILFPLISFPRDLRDFDYGRGAEKRQGTRGTMRGGSGALHVACSARTPAHVQVSDADQCHTALVMNDARSPWPPRVWGGVRRSQQGRGTRPSVRPQPCRCPALLPSCPGSGSPR